MKKSEILYGTVGVCPKCLKIVPATVVEREGAVYIRSKCPVHGEIGGLYFDDIDFFRRVTKAAGAGRKPPEKMIIPREGPIVFRNPSRIVNTIHIHVTDRCNLRCPTCFADAITGNSGRSGDRTAGGSSPEGTVAAFISDRGEPDTDRIIKMLSGFNNLKKKPMIVIVGGEPTLREDLFGLISRLTELGYTVRLSTNGLKLADEKYVKRLAESGLKWVLLQFDGFKSSTSLKFRNADLIGQKIKAIRNAARYGLYIHLIVMVGKDANDDELYRILEYAFDTPSVYAVNFYPVSTVGRYGYGSMGSRECIKRLEEQSGETITLRDFLKCKKLWNLLYILTRRPIFRQKICYFPIFLFRLGGKLYPINRLFSLRQIFRHPIFTLRHIAKLPRLFRWSEKPDKSFLYLNVEKFYDITAMDLKEAFNCHNVFITEYGPVPFCIYNSLYRTRKCT